MPTIVPAEREEPDGEPVDSVDSVEVELIDGIAIMYWLASGSNWAWER
jgi:hypothetical protein